MAKKRPACVYVNPADVRDAIKYGTIANQLSDVARAAGKETGYETYISVDNPMIKDRGHIVLVLN